MTTTKSAGAAGTSHARTLLYATRQYLGTWRGILLLALIALTGGLAFNWSWLVAAGIAPILLTFLPCAVMCGLGLCMKMPGTSRESKALQSRETIESFERGIEK